MEIGDAFIVNKADREGALSFANRLRKMLHQRVNTVPVFETVADKQEGITAVLHWLENAAPTVNEKKAFLYTEKAYKLIQNKRMSDVSRKELHQHISDNCHLPGFNLYQFIERY